MVLSLELYWQCFSRPNQDRRCAKSCANLLIRRLIRCAVIATIRYRLPSGINLPKTTVVDMASQRDKSRAVALPLILFVLTLLPALGLLISAFVMWLSQFFSSVMLSCIVVGGAFLLMAIILYFALLRGVIKRMQERLETVYETSRVVQSGLGWVNEKIAKFWS